ncbi:hypothetical protein E2C01_063099 [Portunus trituberculatus]|uniref:Uncharacterized protein n=1 Tax=Portunus trituberculatus TaxID=210409 RepID=A0A5B7HGL5_PORTR|nr:hypothetical protein [Portunus trituberculatus]
MVCPAAASTALSLSGVTHSGGVTSLSGGSTQRQLSTIQHSSTRPPRAASQHQRGMNNKTQHGVRRKTAARPANAATCREKCRNGRH